MPISPKEPNLSGKRYNPGAFERYFPRNPVSFDAAERKLWALYSEEGEKFDEGLARNWKGDMDSLLIFAGLFTASLTALIIESYRKLQPDSAELGVVLLTQISSQLSGTGSASGGIDLASFNEPFRPPKSILICNFLWFLSLGFALTCALAATLVDQWVRHYLLETTRRASPKTQARIREYLFTGLAKYKIETIVETVPMLLHIALLLFYGGLVAFFSTVNNLIMYLNVGIFSLCLISYLIPTLTPVFASDCPYETPLTSLALQTVNRLRSLLRSNRGPSPNAGSLRVSREIAATQASAAQSSRDRNALVWLLQSFTDEAELEDFVELFPLLCDSQDTYHHAFLHLLGGSASLGRRTIDLLSTCGSHLLTASQDSIRVEACLSASWSMLKLSFSSPSTPAFISSSFTERTWFDLRETFEAMFQTPGWAPHRRSLMTMLLGKVLMEIYGLIFHVQRHLLEGDLQTAQDILSKTDDAVSILVSNTDYHSYKKLGLSTTRRNLRHLNLFISRKLAPGIDASLNYIDNRLSQHLSLYLVHVREILFVLFVEFVLSQHRKEYFPEAQTRECYKFTETAALLWWESKHLGIDKTRRTAILRQLLVHWETPLSEGKEELCRLAGESDDDLRGYDRTLREGVGSLLESIQLAEEMGDEGLSSVGIWDQETGFRGLVGYRVKSERLLPPEVSEVVIPMNGTTVQMDHDLYQ